MVSSQHSRSGNKYYAQKSHRSNNSSVKSYERPTQSFLAKHAALPLHERDQERRRVVNEHTESSELMLNELNYKPLRDQPADFADPQIMSTFHQQTHEVTE